MYNSLENLENTINNLKTQIPKENQDSKSKTNYKKALNYFIQQKNILIENITNNDKEQLMENYNYRGFIYEEKRKRTSWQQDDERKLTEFNFFDSNFQEIEKIEENDDIINKIDIFELNKILSLYFMKIVVTIILDYLTIFQT